MKNLSMVRAGVHGVFALIAMASGFGLGARAEAAPPTFIDEGFIVQVGEGGAVTSPKEIDILWVIDNSGSMQVHHNALMNAAPGFLGGLGASSWRIGMVTTDVQDRTYGLNPAESLNPSQPNAQGVFAQWVARAGINGSATEQPFASIVKNLNQSPGFLRPNAELILVFVTDAREQSTAETQSEVLAAVRAGAPGKIVSTYFFLATSDLGCSGAGLPEGSHAYAGSKYEALAKASNGKTKTFSLCSSQLVQDFQALGTEMSQSTGTGANSGVFSLSYPAVWSSVEVSHSGSRVRPGRQGAGFWLYDPTTNAVVLTDASFLSVGTNEVRVKYQKKQ
jgi:hypothetical protein